MYPEIIRKQDGSIKMDCERNAIRRRLKKLRQDHPRLQFIVNEDALAANAPHIRDLREHDLRFILGVKEGDHKFLFEFVDQAGEGRTGSGTGSNPTRRMKKSPTVSDRLQWSFSSKGRPGFRSHFWPSIGRDYPKKGRSLWRFSLGFTGTLAGSREGKKCRYKASLPLGGPRGPGWKGLGGNGEPFKTLGKEPRGTQVRAITFRALCATGKRPLKPKVVGSTLDWIAWPYHGWIKNPASLCPVVQCRQKPC